MIEPLVLSMLSAVVAAQVPRPETTARTSVVVIGTAAYDAQGRMSSATSAAGIGELFVFTRGSVCDPASITTARPSDATNGWRVSVSPMGFKSRGTMADGASVVLSEVSVVVRWQRLWQGGRNDVGVERDLRLTLRPGDRAPLDNIAGTGKPSSCGEASSMTLSIAPTPVPVAAVASVAAAGGARGNDGAGASAAGRPGSSGGFVKMMPAVSGARGVPASTLNYAYSCSNAQLADPFRSSVVMWDQRGCAAASSELDPTELQQIDVDLWLVHTSAGGATVESYRRVTTTPADGRFAFRPLTFETTNGTRVLEVAGFAQAQRATGGRDRKERSDRKAGPDTTERTDKLEVGFARRIVTADNEPAGLGVGAGSRVIDMPRGNDVVSIEMPPVPGALAGDQFSLRIRVVR